MQRQIGAIENSLDRRSFDVALIDIEKLRRLTDLLEKEVEEMREIYDRPRKMTRLNTHECWPPLEIRAYYRCRLRHPWWHSSDDCLRPGKAGPSDDDIP